jgi:hypothetical protein
MDFSLIKVLFAKTMNGGLSLCRIHQKTCFDNFERIKVAYARDIFRPEMVPELRSNMHDLKEVSILVERRTTRKFL